MTRGILTFLSSVGFLASAGEKFCGPVIQDDAPQRDIWDFVQQDFCYAKTILDWQEDVTEKPLRILEFGQCATTPSVVFSGTFWGNYLLESTNRGGKFPILSRFPGERNNPSSKSSRWVVSNAALAATVRPVDWLTFYAQNEYTEVEFPGQEDWTWRKYYGIIGNLDRFPLYVYYGRNTVDFGWMDGYNPFTHTVNNHFFRVESDHPVIGFGYQKGGLHVVGTMIHSGRQLRVADSNDETGYSNGAVNVSYRFGCDEKYVRAGGGYLHNSIYNNDVPHHPDQNALFSRRVSPLQDNPVYDIFAEIKRGPIRFGVERTETLDEWPATGHDVAATTFQAAYDFCLWDRPTRVSAVYGIGRQGPDGTEFERLTQFVFGVETEVTKFFTISAEYVHNEAFVPLINIRNVSDADVQADAFLIGAKVTF